MKKWKGLILVPIAFLVPPCLSEDSDPSLAIAWEFWLLTTERIATRKKFILTSTGSFRSVLGSMCEYSLLCEEMFKYSITS